MSMVARCAVPFVSRRVSGRRRRIHWSLYHLLITVTPRAAERELGMVIWSAFMQYKYAGGLQWPCAFGG